MVAGSDADGRPRKVEFVAWGVTGSLSPSRFPPTGVGRFSRPAPIPLPETVRLFFNADAQRMSMATNASGDETESDAEYYEISIQETNSGTLVVKAESSDEAWEALEDPDAETRDKMRDAIERDGMPPQPVDRRRAHEFEGNDEYLADVDVTE